MTVFRIRFSSRIVIAIEIFQAGVRLKIFCGEEIAPSTFIPCSDVCFARDHLSVVVQGYYLPGGRHILSAGGPGSLERGVLRGADATGVYRGTGGMKIDQNDP